MASRLGGTATPTTDVGVTVTRFPFTATLPLAVTSTPWIFWCTSTSPGVKRASIPIALASEGPSRVATMRPCPTSSRWTRPWNSSLRDSFTSVTWIDSWRTSTVSIRRSSRLTSTRGTVPENRSRPMNGKEWIEADEPAPGG